jgi:hypothetical protein
MGIRAPSLRVKQLGHKEERRMELYLHSHNNPSWHSAKLKKYRDNFTITRGIANNKCYDTSSLSGGVHHWFKRRSTRGKEICDKR